MKTHLHFAMILILTVFSDQYCDPNRTNQANQVTERTAFVTREEFENVFVRRIRTDKTPSEYHFEDNIGRTWKGTFKSGDPLPSLTNGTLLVEKKSLTYRWTRVGGKSGVTDFKRVP